MLSVVMPCAPVRKMLPLPGLKMPTTLWLLPSMVTVVGRVSVLPWMGDALKPSTQQIMAMDRLLLYLNQ